MAGQEKIQVNDKGWARIRSLCTQYRLGKVASVGIQGEKAAKEHKDPDGVPGTITNVELATIHEFGSSDGHVPERSFIRSTFDEKQSGYKKTLEAIGAAMTTGKTPEGGLLLLGEKFRADIIMAIKHIIPPPLADITVARRPKKDPTPLLDTGQMMNAIDSVVKDADAV